MAHFKMKIKYGNYSVWIKVMRVFKHDAMQTFKGVEVLIHWLLASALHAVESSSSCSWRFLRTHGIGWWDGLARQWSRCDYGLHLNACALVTLQPWWCNGCSRLAPANSYYKRVSFSFGLVLCPPRLLASTSVRLAHEDVIARVKPIPTQFVIIFREYHLGSSRYRRLFMKYETPSYTSSPSHVKEWQKIRKSYGDRKELALVKTLRELPGC